MYSQLVGLLRGKCQICLVQGENSLPDGLTRTTLVVQDVVGHRQALAAARLGRQYRLGLFPSDAIAAAGTLDLRRFVHIDHQYPIGEGSEPVFHQQGDDQQAVGGAGCRTLAQHLGADEGMEQGIEPLLGL